MTTVDRLYRQLTLPMDLVESLDRQARAEGQTIAMAVKKLIADLLECERRGLCQPIGKGH